MVMFRSFREARLSVDELVCSFEPIPLYDLFRGSSVG